METPVATVTAADRELAHAICRSQCGEVDGQPYHGAKCDRVAQALAAWRAGKDSAPVPGTVGKEPISGSGKCGPGCQNEGKCFDEPA